MLHTKKLFLLDMDGTIYLGNRLFDYSLAFLDYITQMGASYIFMTNNSSKNSRQYLQKLNGMNIPATAANLVTSTHATADYILTHYQSQPVYVSGTAAFREELAELGVNITESLTTPVALVMGFDTELTFQKLENMCILLNRNIGYIGSNPDPTCPTEYGYVPDCGSVAQMLKNATKKEPIFIGKPMPTIAEMALKKAAASKAETIIIGDRLFTDIACGIAAEIDTALVLSGESTRKDMETSPHIPKYVFEDLGEMLGELVKISKSQ
ncbi:MAG: HAD-IIA family hydrolase [Defluviitaleaceae bacterium]|nr:HAD-IIA family hydrolase [Defluviitaleaceae bacterium]